MGAQEVVRYLSRHGARRSAGLVLSAPATPVLVQLPDYPDGTPEALLDGQSAAIRSDIGAFIDITASMEDYFGPAEVSKHFDDWTRRQIMETPLFVLLEDAPHLHPVRPPRRNLESRPANDGDSGDADKSAPIEVTGRPTAALLRKGELVLIEEAGHGVYASRAGRYNEELVRFAHRSHQELGVVEKRSGPGVPASNGGTHEHNRPANPKVGPLVRDWRLRRRRSQMGLALDVGMSPRH